jgi:septal ring factor EnvC (AmiA/AmiB activator)
MKRILVVVVLAVLSLVVVRAADAPAFPAESKAKIALLQRDRANLQNEITQIQMRFTQIQTDLLPKNQNDMQAAVDEAFKVAKVDKKDFNVDLNRLEFVAVTKPEQKKP